MKKIEAVIRTNKLEELKKNIAERDLVSGMTISQVLGFGQQKGFEEQVRGKKVRPFLLARVKVEIVCNDGAVEEIVSLIEESAATGEVGDGKIFIYPIERVIRIKNGKEEI